MTSLNLTLERLFQQNPALNEYFSLNETTYNLSRFIFREVKSGKKLINPYKFANDYEMPISKVLVLFFYITSFEDNRIMNIVYRYRCSNNVQTYLYEDELENFSCEEDCQCGSNFNLKKAIETGSEDVPIFFEVDHHLKSQILRLDEASFFLIEEGGVSKSIGIEEISKEIEVMHLLDNMENKPAAVTAIVNTDEWKKRLDESQRR